MKRKDSTFCDDRPSEGTWVEEEEEEEMMVIRMGPVSWIAAQILPRYHDQVVIVNVELNVFEDADEPRFSVCGVEECCM
jgi:hypothetical protein